MKPPITHFIGIILCNNLNYVSESILSICLQYKVNTDNGDRRRTWYSCTGELTAADTVIVIASSAWCWVEYSASNSVLIEHVLNPGHCDAFLVKGISTFMEVFLLMDKRNTYFRQGNYDSSCWRRLHNEELIISTPHPILCRW